MNNESGNGNGKKEGLQMMALIYFFSMALGAFGIYKHTESVNLTLVWAAIGLGAFALLGLNKMMGGKK